RRSTRHSCGSSPRRGAGTATRSSGSSPTRSSATATGRGAGRRRSSSTRASIPATTRCSRAGPRSGCRSATAPWRRSPPRCPRARTRGRLRFATRGPSARVWGSPSDDRLKGGSSMALLERSRWYDLARSTNWTPTYVREDEIFPPDMSDVYGLGMDAWETYDEPYKVSFRDYVRVQREKDMGVYAVREALARSDYYEKADPGWMTVMKAHYGGVTTVEFASASTQARMGRFGKAGGLRNMGAFGSLDEIRHTQTQLV